MKRAPRRARSRPAAAAAPRRAGSASRAAAHRPPAPPGETASAGSEIELRHQRHVVRRLLPGARPFYHPMGAGLLGELGRGPHVVEPPALVLLPPVRAIAPPRIVARGRGDELAAEVAPPV